ncbi:hypothetical protein DI005_10515 [Prauserella sp. PE36]|uniref:Secreted protein n=1 Tax=Prauserella endophytica TaxID=1592324 RepID=A0ABY2SDU8_9PSEU|nr:MULTISPECIES: hypothetical protein [Prauserella]PXY35126.1 hypothetical protein BAY59_06600 [Prauserella coralliicola]RBM21253.1 hypothetical protein DI005_10515 [Prauserella sp. PE36]TKG73661.1 hypothetical protein FCN18_03665 [Prauserella endophytica]
MLYLLAAIGALTIAVLLWRVFGAERVGVPQRPSAVAPDDDPDFLRKLGEQRPKKPDEDDKG